jgi:hypothetical protein
MTTLFPILVPLPSREQWYLNKDPVMVLRMIEQSAF